MSEPRPWGIPQDPRDDIGQRFVVTRVQTLEFELTVEDVDDQIERGESACDSAFLIAGSTPDSEWNTVDVDVNRC